MVSSLLGWSNKKKYRRKRCHEKAFNGLFDIFITTNQYHVISIDLLMRTEAALSVAFLLLVVSAKSVVQALGNLRNNHRLAPHLPRSNIFHLRKTPSSFLKKKSHLPPMLDTLQGIVPEGGLGSPCIIKVCRYPKKKSLVVGDFTKLF